MIRDVVSYLDYSVCAEISLALFVAVFVSVSLRALLTSRASASRMAAIPLDDPPRSNSAMEQAAKLEQVQ